MGSEHIRKSCTLLVERGFLREEQVTTLLLSWRRLARAETSSSLPRVMLRLGYIEQTELPDVEAICSLAAARTPRDRPFDSASSAPRVFALEQLPFRAPDDLERYEVVEELSRGGMGVVFRARHRELRAEVALKVLLNQSPSEEAKERFRREARVLARLKHPNIVSVSDLGEEGGRLFYAMELVDGLDLEQTYLEEGRLGVEWSVGVVRDVAEALAFCHRKGVIHGDVKPTNIIVEREKGLPILVDFGLVRTQDSPGDKGASEALPADLEVPIPDAHAGRGEGAERSFVTRSGHVIAGTPSYMAPEQITPEAGEVGPRSDVYALGATLYFLLSGRPPFTGGSLFRVLTAALRDPPTPLAELNPDVPPAVAKVCHLALSKDPLERPASASLFAEALARALERPHEAPRLDPQRSGAALPRPGTFRRLPQRESKGRLGISWSVVEVPAAVPLSESVHAEEPPSAHVTQLKRGSRKFKKGDYAGAIEAFTLAIELWEGSPAAFSNRGAARYMLKDYPGAVADFDAALSLDPDDAVAYRRRGRAHFKSRAFDAAVEDFSEVIRLDPNNADAYHKRGVAWFRLGDVARSEADEARAQLLTACAESELEDEPSEAEMATLQAEAPPPRPVTVVTLAGSLDHETSNQLEELFLELVANGHTRILCECSGLSYLGSRCASIFLSQLRGLRLAGGDLKFCGLGGKAREVFRLLGLDGLVHLDFAAQDEALRAFERPLPAEWLDSIREGWVGLLSSESYHRPMCPAVREQDPAFQIWFETEDEAVLAGRAACPDCST